MSKQAEGILDSLKRKGTLLQALAFCQKTLSRAFQKTVNQQQNGPNGSGEAVQRNSDTGDKES